MKAIVSILFVTMMAVSCGPPRRSPRPPRKPLPPRVFVTPDQHNDLSNPHGLKAAMKRMEYYCAL